MQERLSLLQRIEARTCNAKADSACNEQRLWLTVSRLAPEKDVGEMFEALAVAETQQPGRQHLVVVGIGPLLEDLRHQAFEKKLPVTFLGEVENAQLPAIYRACDVFIVCSSSETFGITIIEALSCGLPVVLPKCNVFEELFLGSDSKQGDCAETPFAKKADPSKVYAYRKGSTAELVQALGKALKQGTRADNLPPMGMAGIARSKFGVTGRLHTSWKDAAKAQTDQYQSLARRKAQKRADRMLWLNRFLCCS
eukprot:TRINITY_DN17213_c0_g1_i2.p1 TRINITY_DN17213_c0_g1~~TRINITY_DN17213_c0_g1_i2.p1  ORF type:complete len:253 (-),score=50.80 TRINITY_DN17213_c0_g1_i2:11-769(-)